MHQSQARISQPSFQSSSIPPQADSLTLLRVLPPPVERDVLAPSAQAELAERISHCLEGQQDNDLADDLRQATDRLVARGTHLIPLDTHLEESLMRGLQTTSWADICARVLLRAQLSSNGVLALAEAARDRKGQGKILAISLSECASPQDKIFLGAPADKLFEAVTSSFFKPRGFYVKQSLEHHGSFIKARVRHLSARYQADPDDACLTALAETALFLGRCLRPTVRCRATEALYIVSKLELADPLRKATLDAATGLYGKFLRVISYAHSDADRIAFLVHKLPRERLLPCIKQSLAEHVAAKQAQEAAL